MYRSCLMIMADGARDEVICDLVDAGRLPNISEHIIARGGQYKASSVFASTTGPAHLPFLCGLYPGSGDIPGIRWFDRHQLRGGHPLTAMRSYCGIEAGLINRDLSAKAETLYQLIGPSSNTFGAINRGADRNYYAKQKNLLWLYGHLSGDWSKADGYAGRAILRAAKEDRFAFIMYPGIDGHSHHYSPTDRRTINSYLNLDQTIGQLAHNLKQAGRYQETLIWIVSDHGHSVVEEHFDIGPRLQDQGLRVAYHSGHALVRNPDVVSCVSGNAMAHLYLPGPGGFAIRPSRFELDWLVNDLLSQEAIDIIATRLDDGFIIDSRRGQALLRTEGQKINYVVFDQDPFGYRPLPELMSDSQALNETFHSHYPDALVQLLQLLRSERSGDMIVSASLGYDLRDRWEGQEHKSGHGALHRDHMLVPILSSAPLEAGPMRTADVYASTLEWFGLDRPSDGHSRLFDFLN